MRLCAVLWVNYHVRYESSYIVNIRQVAGRDTLMTLRRSKTSSDCKGLSHVRMKLAKRKASMHPQSCGSDYEY